MNKKVSLIIAFVIVIIAGIAIWLFYGKVKKAPTPPEQVMELKDDTTTSINGALNEVSVPDLTGEFSDIDQSIQKL